MNIAAMLLALISSGLCQSVDFDNPRTGKILTIITCPIEQDPNAPVLPKDIPLDPKKRT